MATSSPGAAPARTNGATSINKTNAGENSDSDNDPPSWTEIEHNYFTSMRFHREKEDRDLAADHLARGDALRQQLVDNHHTQEDLLHRLRELRGEYAAGQARLDALDAEVGGVREMMRREREAQDAERRAWFERYRRGGLAYRAGGEEKTMVGTAPAAAVVEGSGDGKGKGSMNGREERAAGVQKQALREEAGVLVNGSVITKEPQPAGAMPEDDGVAQGYEGGEPALASPAADLQKGTPETGSLSGEPEHDHQEHQLEPEYWPGDVADEHMPDAGATSNEQAGEPRALAKVFDVGGSEALPVPGVRKEEPQVVEQDMEDAGAPNDGPTGQTCQPEAVENAMSKFSVVTLLHGQEEERQPVEEKPQPPKENVSATHGQSSDTPAVEHHGPDAAAPSTKDTDMGVFGAPEGSKAVENVGAPKIDDQRRADLPPATWPAAVGVPVADMETYDVKDPSQPVPRSLKRKNPPESSPRKATAAVKPSPSTAGSFSAEATGPARLKKTKIILHRSGLDYSGYTTADSISGDQLHSNEWRLHQVKTQTFATNPGVTQYWHWVAEEDKCGNVFEHQVLKSVRPIKWSVFKKPYNFHLKLADIQEVAFARGSTRVMVTHKKGRDGKDKGPRGDMMAQFKRDRTKRRFLSFLKSEKGVKISEVGK